MKMNLCVVAAFIAGLLFTANPVPSHADGKKTAVVAKSLHLDAAETAWVAMLPSHLEPMPTEFEKSVVMTHPNSKTLAGVQRRPPKKWECKG